MPDNRYKLIRKTPETISATPEFFYSEAGVPDFNPIDDLFEGAKRLPDTLREALKQHLTTLGAPPMDQYHTVDEYNRVVPTERDQLLPSPAPSDMETLSQLLGSFHTGGPKFGLGLIRIPGKDLTVGEMNFKNQLRDMEQGRVPFKEGRGGAGFSGHKLLYDEKPPITVPIPRTADIPLDVYSGLDPQRFQTHVESGGQRFMAGALRGPKPPVRYTRGSNVHYPLPDEMAQTHHPVAHAVSEELDTINPAAGSSARPFKESVTPQALEVVSEIQPETNVSQQGLQIKPPEPTATQGITPQHYSPRLAARGNSTGLRYYEQMMTMDNPKAITVLDDIQDALEGGLLGDYRKTGDPAWWMSMNNAVDPSQNPYYWNPRSMQRIAREFKGVDLPEPRNGNSTDLENFYRGFARAFNIPIRENIPDIPVPPPPPTPKTQSLTQYDQMRVAEAMYNAAREDVKRRGNIPLFGRSGYTYLRGGGGEFQTTPEGVVRPQPGTMDMYENIPRKMGMVPDVVRMESLPETKFNNNLREWGQYMDPANLADPTATINPVGKHIMEQGGFIQAKLPEQGYGHTADLPVWVHPDELEQLKRLGWWTPEKGRGEQLLGQMKDFESYNKWIKEHAPTSGNPLVDEVVAKLNEADPKDFLSSVVQLTRSPDYNDILRNTKGAIRFNLTPSERTALREFMAKAGSPMGAEEFSPSSKDLLSLLYAYGGMTYKPTLKDYIKKMREGDFRVNFSEQDPDTILKTLAKDNPNIRASRRIIAQLMDPDRSRGFGSVQFRSKLAEQLAAGKHKEIVPDINMILNAGAGRANLKDYLESNYPFTVGGIKNPDFNLLINETGKRIIGERKETLTVNTVSGKMAAALKGIMGEDWDSRYVRRALRNQYIPEDKAVKMGKHRQKVLNIVKKDPEIFDALQNATSTYDAAEILNEIYNTGFK